MYQLPQCRMLLWLGMYFCSPWIFAMLQGVGALDTPKPAWKLPSKMGSSTLHRVLLVKYLVHPMAYRRARWTRDLYAAYFGDVAFYGDSNWCFNRGGHRACYGPPNAARSFLGRFGIFQNLKRQQSVFFFSLSYQWPRMSTQWCNLLYSIPRAITGVKIAKFCG